MKTRFQPILLDLDFVIVDITDPLQSALLAETGKYVPVDLWKHYNIPLLYDISEMDFLEIIVKHCVLEESDPYDGAIDGIHILQDAGFPIVACTNRHFHLNANTITRDWLLRHGVNLEGVVINHHDICKVTASRNFGSMFSYMVDDHDSTLFSGVNSGCVKEGILINRPWNAHALSLPDNVVRINEFIQFAMLCATQPQFERDVINNAI